MRMLSCGKCNSSMPDEVLSISGFVSKTHSCLAFRNSNRYHTSTPDRDSVPDIAREVQELKLIITNMNMKGKDSMMHIPVNPTGTRNGRGMLGCVRLKCRNAQNSIACPKQNKRFNMSTTSLNDNQPRHTTPDAESSTPYVGDPY